MRNYPDLLFRDGGHAQEEDSCPRWARTARRMSFLRGPTTSRAVDVTAHVAAATARGLRGTRAVGRGGWATHDRLTGLILGGLARGALNGDTLCLKGVASGTSWREPAIGQRAAWVRLAMMEELGWVEIFHGVQFDDGGVRTPKLAAIRPTRHFSLLLAHYGLETVNFCSDWGLPAEATSVAPKIADHSVLACYAPPQDRAPASVRRRFEAESSDIASRKAGSLQRINAFLRGSHISVSQPPVLIAYCFGSPLLGGRLRAAGSESYQHLAVSDHALVRFNHRKVAHIRYCHFRLSVLLAQAGRSLPEDPLFIRGLARDDAEICRFIRRRLRILERPELLRACSYVQDPPTPTAFTENILRVYPELEDPRRFIPGSLEAVLPFGHAQWAVPYWLEALEAEILQQAIERLMGDGIAALPLGDGIWVAEDASDQALRRMEESFRATLMTSPQLQATLIGVPRTEGCNLKVTGERESPHARPDVHII